MSRSRPLFLPMWVVALVVGAMLTAFYAIAADTHGRRVNTSKARGDQSGYLWDAQNVYHNWHGRQPPMIIGERNRMPLYAGYLAFFYRTGMTDPEYFEVGKRANIGLSIAILFVLGMLLMRHLPRHAALNLLGVVAFGYFVYKAGYTQSELLFYGLLFATFLGCWKLFGSMAGGRMVGLAALTGVLAGLSHLTKAAMPPFVAIVVGLLLARSAAAWFRGERRTAGWHAASAAAFVVLFLIVLAPYLMTSKRVFGHYFYNVNSTFYVWYDDWVHASVGTRLHSDGVGWPDMPAEELPSAGRYWREHTSRQIADRFVAGFADIGLRSYQMFGYLPYLVVFLAAASFVTLTRRQAIRNLVTAQPWLVLFLAAYGSIYLLATAFYHPTSGTGTGRFFLAHLTPLFFALSALLTSRETSRLSWSVAGRTVTLDAFHALVTVMLTLDILFRAWPRLMSTYGGF